MYRKMTLLALAAKCGGRGANGLIGEADWTALVVAPNDPSPAKAASATAPKPLAQRLSISRRESGGRAKFPQW